MTIKNRMIFYGVIYYERMRIMNYGICLSLLNRLYLYSVQFMCIFAHGKLMLQKMYVHFCMFTERS